MSFDRVGTGTPVRRVYFPISCRALVHAPLVSSWWRPARYFVLMGPQLWPARPSGRRFFSGRDVVAHRASKWRGAITPVVYIGTHPGAKGLLPCATRRGRCPHGRNAALGPSLRLLGAPQPFAASNGSPKLVLRQCQKATVGQGKHNELRSPLMHRFSLPPFAPR